MREQVVYLEDHDDHHTARDKMGQAQVDRILVVWPTHTKREATPLIRKLDLLLMHRHASRLGAHLGIICSDDHIYDNATELGIPVFDTVSDAHLFLWRSRRSLRPNFSPPPTTPPTLEIARQLLSPITRDSTNRIKFAVNSIFTAIAVLASTTALLLTLPAAEVRLTPRNQKVSLRIDLTAHPNLTEPDYTKAQIPALTESTVASSTIEVTTSGITHISTKAASGVVIFTNLTTQSIRIPAGTAVRTSGGTPIRFVTQSDITVPANRGMISTAPVLAAEAGPSGNVGISQINRVNGLLDQRVVVSNRQPTTGGETISVPSVTLDDRTRAYQALLAEIRHTGYSDIASNLRPHQFTTIDSASVTKVTETNYSHSVGEHADVLTLDMRATVTASIVHDEDAFSAGLYALQNSISSDMSLDEGTISHSPLAGLSGTDTGTVSFNLTTKATALANLDENAIRRAIRWKPIDEATDTLYALFPLARPPVITIRPGWFTRTPWLEWRTDIKRLNPSAPANHESAGS